MLTSTLARSLALRARTVDGLHVAIVMDGNGRWARRRGRPRWEGHRAGGQAVSRVVEAAPGFGIKTLTLYAFSSDNWRRPATEVGHIMRLFEHHLRSETDRCIETGVRVSVIGRRSRLPDGLRRQIEVTEACTRSETNIHVRLAVDYSSRDAMLGAVALLGGVSDSKGVQSGDREGHSRPRRDE